MKCPLISATALLLLLGLQQNAHACTTILVGKGATIDGSLIIARNVDSTDASAAQNLFIHPPRKETAQFLSNGNEFRWNLPPNALEYSGIPVWRSFKQTNLSFEETGINEYGVAISATETIFNSEAVLRADPMPEKTGITEDSITSVVLPYATSAKDGIRLLGAIIEQAGISGEGFGVAFSDQNEIWYLETAAGHHWVAQRLPDDRYFVSANQGRFQSLDFDDPMNTLTSTGFREFLIENKLYDPAKEPFNFFRCCIKDDDADKTYNYPRVRELLSLYSEITYPHEDGLYPVFVKPARKLSVQDVAAGLRNHYDGTEHDPYLHQNPKEPWRPISVMRANISHITQTHPDLPRAIGVVQYLAFGMPELSAYAPFYQGITEVPAAYQGATDQIEDHSIYWINRRVQALVLQDYPRLAPLARRTIAAFEADTAKKQAALESAYLAQWKTKPDAAKQKIQRFTNEMVAEQVRVFRELARTLAIDLKLENLSPEAMRQLIMETEQRYHFHGA